MLYISVDEIKYGTVGATFNVAFSVPIDELPQLRELHDKYAELNMKSFSLTASTADTPQADEIGDCNICRFAGCSECDDCINGSEWVRETEIDDLD
jgi:hypothetical protein